MGYLKIVFSWISTKKKKNTLSFCITHVQLKLLLRKLTSSAAFTTDAFKHLSNTFDIKGEQVTWKKTVIHTTIVLYETSALYRGLFYISSIGGIGTLKLERITKAIKTEVKSLYSLPRFQRGSDRCLSSWRYRKQFPVSCSSGLA